MNVSCGLTNVTSPVSSEEPEDKGQLRKTGFYSSAPTEAADSNCDQQSAELKILVLFLGDYRYH